MNWGFRKAAAILSISSVIFSLTVNDFALASSDPCRSAVAIVGTDGNDVLTGTPGKDTICGGAGDDVIAGLGGDDILLGSSGNDQIQGGTGNDKIFGGIGDDNLAGGSGNDSLSGESGLDNLYGDSGLDVLTAGPGADNLYGGDGVDKLFGGTGDDGLNGQQGADYINGDEGSDTCVKDALDKQISCFFDQRGPQLINIAMAPGSIEVDASSLEITKRIFRFRFTLSDPGTGVSNVSFAFGAVDNTGEIYNNSLIQVNRLYDSCWELEKSLSLSKPTAANPISGSCLIEGNLNRGVYEGVGVVPSNAKTAKYRFASFSAADLVGNRSLGSTLTLPNIAVSFKQVGLVDSTGITINDFAVMGDPHLKNSKDYALGLLTFSGEGSPLEAVRVNFSAISGDGSYAFLNFASSALPLACEEKDKGAVPCLASGTLTSGVLQFPLRYIAAVDSPRYYSPSQLFVSSIYVEDKNGNAVFENPVMTKRFLEVSFYKDFTSGDSKSDGDTSSPIIKNFNLITKKINTSTAAQSFEYSVTVADEGVGMNFDQPGIQIFFQFENVSTTIRDCRLTGKIGTKFEGTYTYTCNVPKNSRKGKIVFYSISINDSSIKGNNIFFDNTTDPTASEKYPIFIQNG